MIPEFLNVSPGDEPLLDSFGGGFNLCRLDLIGPPKSPGIHHGSRHNETGMQHLLEGLMVNSFVM